MKLDRPGKYFVIAVLCGAFGFPMEALAAEGSAPATKKYPANFSSRTLSGHRFIPPTGAESAFITSHFGFTQGATYARFEKVKVPFTDIEESVRLAGMMERLHLALPIQEWLSVYGNLDGQALSGINLSSAVYHGAAFSVAWQLGIAIRLTRLEKAGLQLALRLKWRGKRGKDVVPIHITPAVIERVNDGEPISEDDADLGSIMDVVVLGRYANYGGLSFHWAQSSWKHIGLQQALEVVIGGIYYQYASENEAVSIDATQGRVTLTSDLSITMNPYFPLGVLFEHRLRGVFDNVKHLDVADLSTSRHRIGVGIYFTGRDNLLLGAFFATRIHDNESPLKYYYGQIVMKYFF